MKEFEEKKISVAILGASFETRNLGVAALACGTVASIYHAFPNARIFLIDYAKKPAIYQVACPDGVATVELVNIRFSKKLYLSNNIAYLLLLALFLKILPLQMWRMRIINNNKVLKSLHRANVIGSIAGGDSFSDIYGMGRLIYIALPQILVLLLGKPLVLLPQTYGPFKGALAKMIAGYIVRRANKIYSRDHEGIEKASEFVGSGDSRLSFSYDMGYAMEPKIKKERIPSWLAKHDRGTPLVGINISGLLYIGGYTQRNMFGLKADYHTLLIEINKYFVLSQKAEIVLVPHVFGAGEDSESDLSACRKIFGEIDKILQPHVHLLEEEYDQHELKALIGRCDFFLGSRMHACIGALSQCVPAVGLAYSKKFRGVFQSVGMEELVIDLREHDESAVIALLDRIYKRHAELRAQLEAKIPGVRKSVMELFSRRNLMLS